MRAAMALGLALLVGCSSPSGEGSSRGGASAIGSWNRGLPHWPVLRPPAPAATPVTTPAPTPAPTPSYSFGLRFSSAVDIAPGDSAQLEVHVTRSAGSATPIEVRFGPTPDGISVSDLTIAAEDTSAHAEITTAPSARIDPSFLDATAWIPGGERAVAAARTTIRVGPPDDFADGREDLLLPVVGIVSHQDHLLALGSGEQGCFLVAFEKSGAIREIYPIAPTDSSYRAQAIQESGGRLYAMFRGNSVSGTVTVLSRLSADGAIDGTYGRDGFAVLPRPADAFAVAPDGSLYVSTYDVATGTVISRFDSAGERSESFGTAGDLRLPRPRSIAADSQGRLLVGTDHQVARYLSDGALDSSFGTTGVVDLGGVAILPVVIVGEAEGHVLAARGRGGDSYPEFQPTLFRLAANGSLDQTFGVNGRVDLEHVHALAVSRMTDGSIVCAGAIGSQGVFVHAAVRLTPEGRLDSSFGTGGVWSWKFASEGITVVRSIAEVDQALVLFGPAEDWNDVLPNRLVMHRVPLE